jgi:hypothetical protein
MSKPFVRGAKETFDASRRGVEARARKRAERAGLEGDPRKILERIDHLQQEIVRLATKLARMKLCPADAPAVPNEPAAPSSTDVAPPTREELERRVREALNPSNGHAAVRSAAVQPIKTDTGKVVSKPAVRMMTPEEIEEQIARNRSTSR